MLRRIAVQPIAPFLQACESFGFNGRAISISQGRWQNKCTGGGHEVVELWSNEWKKWVYVDGALGWYIVDPQTGTPLSMWELRRRQLPTLHGDHATIGTTGEVIHMSALLGSRTAWALTLFFATQSMQALRSGLLARSFTEKR